MNLDTVANFIWFWSHEFFLETDDGNFIWSDPDYPGGDNTIKPFDGSLKDFCNAGGPGYGRVKGRHTIRAYCGDQVKFIEE